MPGNTLADKLSWGTYVYRPKGSVSRTAAARPPIAPAERAAWFHELRTDIERGQLSSLVVVVHGFATSFEDAHRRVAHLTIRCPRAAFVSFSWPSAEGVLQWAPTVWGWLDHAHENPYSKAYRIATQSQADLREALLLLSRARLGVPIDVVAHSMGCRLSLGAITSKKRPVGGLRNLVLAAPDVNRAVFYTQVPALSGLVTRTTVYGHEGDAPLWLSSFVAHPGQGPRLGQIRVGDHHDDRYEYVSGSFAREQWPLFHSEIFRDRDALEDLTELLTCNRAAKERALIRRDQEHDGAWIIVPRGARVPAR